MKQKLRKKYKQIRKGIPDKAMKSLQIANKLKNHFNYQQSNHIAFYSSFGSEADTHEMILRALADHKHVYLPKVVNKQEMDFYEIQTLDDMIDQNAFGIKEPKESCIKVKAEDIELMILPGLCFDLKGNRLGYGGGYYDRYLQGKMIYKIGICFDEQILNEELETDEYDIQMDEVITDKRQLAAGGKMIDEVRYLVAELLKDEQSGHGMDHIERVLNLSLKFCEKEKAHKEITALIALLHDVDDYKLFGIEGAQELNHAKRIMKEVQIDSDIQQQVLEALSCIGYSKALKGIRPKTIEGKIVSDADMCDAIGATGILRAYTYSMKKGKPFFNKDVFPIENLNADTYIQRCSESSCNHFFEKLLKLKGMMMTEAGKKEAKHRHEIMVSFLYHYFEEENVPEWREYLDNYLKLKI
ncbi:5-formyltetrahydrofolate cyclo-ligase [Traorella massiliensis]|uniref:5-formyltetrahydrofolate cyclo-ligase n=1 Tax=Traorella massiliensis TaxID=1903263 RepID=UPI0023543102|nr:5-formyltetrahydrofolate cyclo-ligase [Traorella massiliensis]